MYALVKRDLLLAYRQRGFLLNPLVFFWIIVGLFPLSITPDPLLLRLMGPGVLWMAALLATLLALEVLFRSDYEDGSLEQILISSGSLFSWVLAKTAAHWLVTGLPLSLFAPLLAVIMQIPVEQTPIVVVSLLIGTPILSLIGTFGSALTLGLKRGGMLLPLLILPLYIPVLVFGSSVISKYAQQLPVTQPLAFLGALLAVSLLVTPLATAFALRVSLSR